MSVVTLTQHDPILSTKVEGGRKELNKNKFYSKEEVAQHNSKDDCWIIINNKVYDVTSWLPRHPGGGHLILNMAGQDCTEEFKIFHLEPNYKYLKLYLVGQIKESEQVERTTLAKDIDNIVEDLKKRGAFLTDGWLYVRLSSIIILLVALSLYSVTHTDSYAWVSLGAVFLGLAWQQLAFIGHDLGHHVVTHEMKQDDFISIFAGNLIQGISLAWWKHNHNTHHVLTNSIEHDPDIQHLPFMAVSPKFFKSLYSTYYNRIMKFDALGKFFIPYQHFWFYIVMSFARFNLYAQSFIFNLVGPGSRSDKRNIELLSLAGFWCWLSFLLYTLPSLSHILLFLFISHATAGIVHVQITINHFSMSSYEGVPQHSFESDGYIKSQLTTTTNIDCPPWLDFLQGGLQFQIEHHLFPHVTRSHFRYLKKRVEELCAKHGLTYVSKSFWRANYDVLVHLRETGKQARISEFLWEGLNAVG